MNRDIHDILLFWFGDAPDDAAAVGAWSARWWAKDAGFDAEIARRFGALRSAAISGGLNDWLAVPQGRLAMILLVDQFSRNLYRGSPEAFAHDALARHWCHEGLAHEVDRALLPVERWFFYMPLEHSEAREDQAHAVRLFTALRDEAQDEWRALFDSALGFAELHREIIERYGRFPHRNAVLGRVSSVEELEFLKQPGSSF